ncbi:hypothetical protein HDU98_010024, partial [Podochytrium sp. JEL0797]
IGLNINNTTVAMTTAAVVADNVARHFANIVSRLRVLEEAEAEERRQQRIDMTNEDVFGGDAVQGFESFDMGEIFNIQSAPIGASDLSTMWKQLDLLEQRGVLINELYKQIEILKMENTSLKAQIAVSKLSSIHTSTLQSSFLQTATAMGAISPPSSASITPTSSLPPPKMTHVQWTEAASKFHVPLGLVEAEPQHTATPFFDSPESGTNLLPMIAPAATPATFWKESATRFPIPTDVLDRLHQKQIPTPAAFMPSPSIGSIRSPTEYTICAIAGISRRNISELKNDLKKGNVDTTKIANIQFTSDNICEVLLLKCYADQFCNILSGWNFDVLPGGTTLFPPPTCANVTHFYNSLFRRFKRTISRQSTENITSNCYEFILNEILSNNPELQELMETPNATALRTLQQQQDRDAAQIATLLATPAHVAAELEQEQAAKKQVEVDLPVKPGCSPGPPGRRLDEPLWAPAGRDGYVSDIQAAMNADGRMEMFGIGHNNALSLSWQYRCRWGGGGSDEWGGFTAHAATRALVNEVAVKFVHTSLTVTSRFEGPYFLAGIHEDTKQVIFTNQTGNNEFNVTPMACMPIKPGGFINIAATTTCSGTILVFAKDASQVSWFCEEQTVYCSDWSEWARVDQHRTGFSIGYAFRITQYATFST